MDIKMAMPGSTMMDMMMGSPGAPGSLSGTMLGALGLFDGGVAGGYFDFADSNPYTGATQGTGFAGKLGFTYKVDDKLTVGGTYHSKTSLGDLKGDADISMVGVQGGADALVAIDGEMTINNFQWPTTMGLGVSFQYNDKLRLAADVKRIKWADVMKDFSMSFVASQSASNIAYGANGATLDAVLYQNWVDQTVLQIGGEYQATNALVLRAGMSKSDNPIPSTTLNHLFPASVQDSMTFGMGYAFSNTDDVNFALSVVPKESVNTGAGMTIDHAQTNWQLMYSKKF
jgi:long-chain fatty acid transport protein